MSTVTKTILIVLAVLALLALGAVILFGGLFRFGMMGPGFMHGWSGPFDGPGMMRGFGLLGWLMMLSWIALPVLLGALLIGGVIALLRRPNQPGTPPSPNAISGLTCPNCGRAVQSDWQNCPYCGTRLKPEEPGSV